MEEQPAEKAQGPLDKALSLWWRLVQAERRQDRGRDGTSHGDGPDREPDRDTKT
jgi:hypothetical protein